MEGENFIIVTDDDESVLSRRSYQPLMEGSTVLTLD